MGMGFIRGTEMRRGDEAVCGEEKIWGNGLGLCMHGRKDKLVQSWGEMGM